MEKIGLFKFRLLLFCLLLSPTIWCHEYYVSICQIDYNSKKESLEITFKMFFDNLENALQTNCESKIYLNREKETSAADSCLIAYIQKCFEISVNGEICNYQYLGKNIEDDVVNCFVGVTKVPKIKNLAIGNTLLMDLFERQSNILRIVVGELKKSIILRKGKSVVILNIP